MDFLEKIVLSNVIKNVKVVKIRVIFVLAVKENLEIILQVQIVTVKIFIMIMG